MKSNNDTNKDSFSRWINKIFNFTPRKGNRNRRKFQFQPKLESIEDRIVPSTITVISDNDSGAGSLRAALSAASSGDTIDFGPTARDIVLTSSGLTVGTNVTIIDDNAQQYGSVTINGGGTFTVFDVNSGVTATLAGLTITDGSASVSGGGIVNEGNLTVSNCTFSSNSATANGGGIDNSSNLTVENSTFINNKAPLGGGILNVGSLNATDNTFYENTASVNGGGIFNDGGTMTASNNTFYKNSAADFGGGLYITGSSLLNGNILVGNTGSGGMEDDINGIAFNTSSSDNLVDIDNTGTLTAANGNHLGVTAAQSDLTPPGWYGGPTETIGLLPDSPALGKGITSASITYDQRGFARPINSESDIGAYQYSGNSQPLVVNTTTDSNLVPAGLLSLQNAVNIVDADTDISTSEPISFNQLVFSTPQTISLTSGLTLGGSAPIASVSIAGPAKEISISGTNTYSVLTVDSGVTASISNLTIEDGAAQAVNNNNGGGVYNSGTLTLQHVIVNANAASNFGGGIYNNNGEVNVTSCSITGNDATKLGSGLYVSAGSATVHNSTFSGNTGGSGGGIYNNATANVFGSTFSSNDAGSGGGIANHGTLTVTGSTFNGNSATNDGGGIVNYSSMHITNNTFYENAAGTAGGGVSNGAGTAYIGAMSATDNTFYKNSAVSKGGGLFTSGSSLLNGDLFVGNIRGVSTADDISGNSFNSGSSHNLVGVDNTSTLKQNITNLTGVTVAQAGLSSAGLANNGGPTETIGLTLGSYALGKGLAITSTSYPSTDQRGVARPGNNQNGDIGAFQFSNPPSISSNPSSPTIVLPGTTTTSFAIAAGDIFNDGVSPGGDTTSVSTTIQWQVSTDGGQTFNDISGGIYGTTATTPTLIINGSGDASQAELEALNGDEYRAVVTNPEGQTAISEDGTLTADYAPAISAEPETATVDAGAPASFTATADGSPGVTGIEWEYDSGSGFTAIGDGGTLPGGDTVSINTSPLPSTDPASTLIIDGTNDALNGLEFEAVFTNSIGTSTSDAATLTVDYAPTNVSPPTSTTVNSGATNVTFSASANADPAASVQWYLSTNNGANYSLISGTGYSGVNTDTLTVTGPVTAAMNDYKYEAVFSNSLGSATTSAATLTVNSAPSITAQPLSEAVVEGNAAAFTATASSNPNITGIQWEYSNGSGFVGISNGGKLPGGSTVSINTSPPLPSSNPTSTLTINGVTTALKGYKFESVFTNSIGSTPTSPATLTVNNATSITITGDPTSGNVLVGDNGSFTATATSNPTPTVQWDVSTNGGITFTPISSVSVYGNSFTSDTLTLTDPPVSMNGYEYKAVFSNGFSPPVSTTAATLTVGTVPAIASNPTNEIINIGGRASFTATANGTPAPKVQWEVNENNGIGFTAISNGSVYTGTTTGTLTISSVTAAMNGYKYEAVFSNVFGSTTTASATLSDLGLVITEGPSVLIYDTHNNLVDKITPFGSNVTSVQATVGNLNTGANSDLVIASGPGGGQIDVYNGISGPIAETITPYTASYTGGVNVALGNVLNTNKANVDIVVAPDTSGRSVAVFSATGTYLAALVPFPNGYPNRSYTGGLNVAVGNLTGSGQDTIAVGTNAPQAAFVGQWNYNGSQFVGEPTLSYPGEGAYVSTLTLTPGGIADLVVGTDNLNGTSAIAHVYIQNTNGKLIAEVPSNGLNVFDYGNSGQVRVGVMDVNGNSIPDIVVATGPGSTQEVRVFDLNGSVPQLVETLSSEQLDLTSGFNGGLYVG